MTQEEKDTALGQINLIKMAFHTLHLQLPKEMCQVDSTAFRLETQLLLLEREIRSRSVKS